MFIESEGTTSTIFNSQSFLFFFPPLRSGPKKDIGFCYFNVILGFVHKATRQEKEMKSHPDWDVKSQTISI